MAFKNEIFPFGRDNEEEINIINNFCTSLNNTNYSYFFIKEDIFKDIIENNIREAIKIYWYEILLRCHWVASTSILRNQRWVNGVLNSIKEENYFSFAANMRGLIESATDSYDSLKYVTKSIAEWYSDIEKALTLEKEEFFHSAELETILIHFTHARKIDNREAVPNSHQAKTARDYINGLRRDGIASLHDCYSELCELSHPASKSVYAFIDDDNHLLTLNADKDLRNIHDFCERYKEPLSTLIYVSFNPSLLLLNTLNYFSNQDVYTEAINNIDLKGIPAWIELEEMLTNKHSS